MKTRISGSRGRLFVVLLLALALAMLFGNAGISAETPVTAPEEARGPAILSMGLLAGPLSTPSGTPSDDKLMVVVTLDISGFRVVNKGSPNAPGEGHVIYYYGAQPATIPDRAAYTAEGTYYSTSANPFTWLEVTPGYKNFAAQLVNNDDTPLDPPVYAQIRTYIQPGDDDSPAITAIKVECAPPSSPAPTPAIAQPAERFDSIIVLEVSGFDMSSKLGQRNSAGEGHIIYYENMPPRTVPGRPAYPPQGTYYATTFVPFMWLNASPDYYSYAAQLVNNDDTPLEHPVFAELCGYLAVKNSKLQSEVE